MAARPPADDGLDDAPETVAFGIAALNERVKQADITFPTDADALRRSIGGDEIPYNSSGASMTVAAALDQVHVSEFENEQELLNVLHPVFEEQRVTASTGLLSRLRSLIPI